MRWLTILLTVAFFGACDDPNVPDTTTLRVKGSVEIAPGVTFPQSSKVIVLWSVFTQQGEKAFKYGDGKASASGFDAVLGLEPPKAMYEQSGFAFGWILLVDGGLQLSDGELDQQQVDSIWKAAYGGASRYALVYSDGTKTWNNWADSFATGLSCGEGTPGDGIHNGLTPVDCSAVRLDVDDVMALPWLNLN